MANFEVSKQLLFAIQLPWRFLGVFYILVPVFFLYILAWSLSELFAEICKEMERAFANGGDVGRIVQVSGVRHSLVCQAVWRLEAFFQNNMLVSVTCNFVHCISLCYLLLDKVASRNFEHAATFLFALLIRFVLLDRIGEVAERLKNKVTKLSRVNVIQLIVNVIDCHINVSKIIDPKGRCHSPVPYQVESAVRSK